MRGPGKFGSLDEMERSGLLSRDKVIRENSSTLVSTRAVRFGFLGGVDPVPPLAGAASGLKVPVVKAGANPTSSGNGSALPPTPAA